VLGRSLISLWLPPGQDTQYKLYYHHATLHMHWSVKRVIQNVNFIPSPNMTTLSVRRPAFPNISRDSCGAQCDYKSETLCVPIQMPYHWYTNREQGRVGMVSHTCARRTVQSRRIGKIVTIWLSSLGGKSNEVRRRNRDNGVCSCTHSHQHGLGATVPNYTGKM
jgi:hypothetical protein